MTERDLAKVQRTQADFSRKVQALITRHAIEGDLVATIACIVPPMMEAAGLLLQMLPDTHRQQFLDETVRKLVAAVGGSPPKPN